MNKLTDENVDALTKLGDVLLPIHLSKMKEEGTLPKKLEKYEELLNKKSRRRAIPRTFFRRVK